MAAPLFYNQGDQNIYKDFQFVPQEKYRTGFTAPVQGGGQDASTPSFGIPATNAFTNSGGGSGGNAFGYGTAIKPGDPSVLTSGPYQGQSGYSDSLNYSGGLPGNVSQKGPGRHFEYDNTGAFYKDYSLTPRREVPGLLRAGAAFVPFGNFALNQIENKMNPEGPFTKDDNPYGGNYGIAGLSDAQKEAYNSLAAAGGLFQGPSGMKTLTGKNFGLTDKAFGNYMDKQRDIFNDLTSQGLSVNANGEVVDDDGNIVTGFKAKQLLEASALHKDKVAKEKALQLAEKNRLAGLVGTTGTDPNTGTTSIIQGESGGNTAGTSRASDHGKAAGLGHNAGNVREANAAGTGSAQGYNQNLRSGGRAGYFFGGRVNFKAGGRTDAGPKRTTASKAGVGQINESGQKVSGGNFNNNDGGNNNNPPVTVVEDQTSIFDTSGLKSKSPEIGFNYMDPKNYASLKSRIYNTNILDNDNINVEGNLSGEIGPVSYNTNFTDQGITGTNLTAGNFNANISPDMQLENLSYSKGPFRISSDGQNTKAGLTFSYKNGGLAGLL